MPYVNKQSNPIFYTSECKQFQPQLKESIPLHTNVIIRIILTNTILERSSVETEDLNDNIEHQVVPTVILSVSVIMAHHNEV